MLVVTRFRCAPDHDPSFPAAAAAALAALAARPGYLRGSLGQAVDDPTTWALVTEWDSVGSYRRGLSSYDVKLATAPLMAFSIPEPGAFEVVAAIDLPQPPGAPPTQVARQGHDGGTP